MDIILLHNNFNMFFLPRVTSMKKRVMRNNQRTLKTMYGCIHIRYFRSYNLLTLLFNHIKHCNFDSQTSVRRKHNNQRTLKTIYGCMEHFICAPCLTSHNHNKNRTTLHTIFCYDLCTIVNLMVLLHFDLFIMDCVSVLSYENPAN